jgi:hypothetical protein
MLAFRDFVPQDDTPMLALSRRREALDKVLGRVNAWVAESGADVLNIETVMLPEAAAVSAQTSASASFNDSTQYALGMFEFGGNHLQVLRVWYRAG